MSSHWCAASVPLASTPVLLEFSISIQFFPFRRHAFTAIAQILPQGNIYENRTSRIHVAISTVLLPKCWLASSSCDGRKELPGDLSQRHSRLPTRSPSQYAKITGPDPLVPTAVCKRGVTVHVYATNFCVNTALLHAPCRSLLSFVFPPSLPASQPRRSKPIIVTLRRYATLYTTTMPITSEKSIRESNRLHFQTLFGPALAHQRCLHSTLTLA
jgi:hypothetical protein